MRQMNLFNVGAVKSDVVYTPNIVSIDIINWLKPEGQCLDPCLGDGSFFDNLPGTPDWCELEMDRDFFDYSTQVDWIIGNPPYSIFEEFLRHSFELADDVAFLVPTNKVFQRMLIMDMINEFGGIKGMRIYGSGTNIGFPFGFSVGAFHFSKSFDGNCALSIGVRCHE